jgi:hypothetical protein
MRLRSSRDRPGVPNVSGSSDSRPCAPL